MKRTSRTGHSLLALVLLCSLLPIGCAPAAPSSPVSSETAETGKAPLPAGTAEQTEVPQTAAPETKKTGETETAAPETAGRETEPAETETPETAPPQGGSAETAAPETAAPETEAPEGLQGGDPAAPVVFVTEKGAGKKDGSSPENAAALADGLGKTKKTGGTVVVCGPLTFPETYYFPSNEATVTLTSVRDGIDYRKTSGAKLSFSADANFYGDYLLEGLAVSAEKNNLFFCFQYNNVTVGADVECSRASGVSTYIALLGGYNAPSSLHMNAYQIGCHKDAAVTVKSGTWQYLRGGNSRMDAKSAFGTVDEGVSFCVYVKGGRFIASSGQDFNSASGMNSVAGTVYMEISGGTFDGPVYLLSRTESNPNRNPVAVTGSVTLKITGGTFLSKDLAVRQVTSDAITVSTYAKTVLCVTGGSFPAGTVAKGNPGARLLLGSAVSLTGSAFTVTEKNDASCLAVRAPALTANGIRYTDPPSVTLSATTPLTDAEKDALGPDAKTRIADVDALIAEQKKRENSPAQLAGLYSEKSRTLDDPAYSLYRVESLRFVSLLTGEYSDNRTLSNYDIARVGGGYMIDCGDSVLLAFGDSNSEDGLGKTWRANSLAFTSDFDYTDGIRIDGFYMGDSYQSKPFAGEFLPSLHKKGTEESKIPTGGLKIGDTLYFYYMSVNAWGTTGRNGCWPCNYGALAKSTDMGRSWEISSDLRWPAGTDVSDPVAQVPLYGLAQLYPVLDGEWVYVFGVPGGRKGACRIMRVKASQIEDFSAYEYMTGRDENGNGIFERGYDAMMSNYAAVEAAVGGVGVMYNEYLGEWVILYCTAYAGDLKNSIVMRTAKTLDGVWSDPVLIIKQGGVMGAVYEPRVSSVYTREGGRYMMVITSRATLYQSFVWEIEVSKK
ncbi:MAG: DUF4185 domain-containing protein [Clostridia bacterium]|nr:DUF4185 domain-containing protein [Clostridia bacterium]